MRSILCTSKPYSRSPMCIVSGRAPFLESNAIGINVKKRRCRKRFKATRGRPGWQKIISSARSSQPHGIEYLWCNRFNAILLVDRARHFQAAIVGPVVDDNFFRFCLQITNKRHELVEVAVAPN